MELSNQNNNNCKNKKFGHNFPYPGAKCLNCGISQNELSPKPEKMKTSQLFRIKKSKKNLHSKNHLLADELSRYFNEPKRFGMYLGIIGRAGFENTYKIFSEIKQSKAKEKTKLFMWKIAQLKTDKK